MRRSQFDDLSQPHRNLAINPSFEAAAGAFAMRTNLVTNPSFETASGTVNVRTNLATNPSFEATGGAVTVRTNLATNPSFEVASGTVDVRTNLATAEKPVALGAGATLTTGVAYNGTIWSRAATVSTGHGIRQHVPLASLVNGATYAVEWEVANDSAVDVPLTLDWCDVGGKGYVIKPGQRTRISTSGSKATYDATFRFADLGLNLADTSILFREVIIERDAIQGRYFDGSTPIKNLVTNADFETDLAGWASNHANLIQSRDTTTSYSGVASLKAEWNLDGVTAGVNNNLETMSVTPGEIITGSAWVKAKKDTALSVMLRFRDAAGASTGDPNGVQVTVGTDWKRISFSSVVPANSVRVFIQIHNNTASVIGDTFWVDNVLVESSDKVNPYFKGQGDFTYAWTGTAGASVSVQQAPGALNWSAASALVKPFRDTYTKSHRGASLRVPGTPDGNRTAQATFPAAAGKIYTVSADMMHNSAVSRELHLDYTFQDAAGVRIGSYNSGATGLTAGNSWFREVTTTIAAPANTATITVYPALIGGLASELFWVDAFLLEEMATPLPYFDGTTAAANDLTYQWTGLADESTSQQRGTSVTGYTSANVVSVASTGWSARGVGSLRSIPVSSSNDSYTTVGGDGGAMRAGLVAGKTYTISVTCRLLAPQTGSLSTSARRIRAFSRSGTAAYIATLSAEAPNVAGSSRISVTFSIPSDATEAFIRLQNGATTGNGDVWWDDLLIEEGTYLGDYFDGANPIRNLATNPSFETDTAGWKTYLCTISRDTTEFRSGVASLKVVTSGAGGPSLTTPVPEIPGMVHTQSMWVKAPSGQSMFIQMLQYNSGNTNVSTTTVGFTGTGEWQRVSVSAALAATAVKTTPYVYADVSGVTFWIDDVLIERSTTLNPYYEGTGDFAYVWSGTANASASIQQAPGAASALSNNPSSVSWQSVSYKFNGSKSLASKSTSSIYGHNGVKFVAGSLTANTQYTFSAWVFMPSLYGKGLLAVATGGGLSGVVGGALVTTVGEWARVSVTFTPVNTTSVIIYVVTDGADKPPVGQVFYTDAWLLEASPIVLNYFDGAATAAGDYTYMWSGTAHASTSQQRAVGAWNVSSGNSAAYQSGDWTASGTKSLRLTPLNQYNQSSAILTGVPLEKGKTYTAIATRRLPAPLTGTLSSYAGTISSVQTDIGTFYSPPLPNVAGVAQAKLKFYFDPASGPWTLRLGHGGSAGSGDVWWDNVMIVEGDYTGDYIDGSKVLAKWDGTADASTSVGYPPQLLDIAGKPDLDLIGVGATPETAVPGFAARTFYIVYEVTDNTLASWQPVFGYGRYSATDGWTLQTAMAGNASMSPRADFATGGGATNAGIAHGNARTNGRVHIISAAFNEGLTNWSGFANGGPDSTRTLTPGTVGWPSHRISASSLSGIKGVRSLVYWGEHDRATRLAISRYLGNKYGANVA